jgi:hypothetical protein
LNLAIRPITSSPSPFATTAEAAVPVRSSNGSTTSRGTSGFSAVARGELGELSSLTANVMTRSGAASRAARPKDAASA